MKLLFATDRLHPPDDFSGSVQSTHALMLGLLERGHQCEILASLPAAWKHALATGLFRLSGRRVICEWPDTANGYRVRRGSEWRFAERVVRGARRYSPDAVILDSIRQLRFLEAASFSPPCPLIVVNHDVRFADGSRELPFKPGLRIVANSPYTAAVASRHFGVDATVVPPVVQLDRYRTDRPSPSSVTLVSPNPQKGLDLVLELASRLPRTPFLLVEGWPMERRERRALQQRIRLLHNVTLRPSSREMLPVFRETRVLLAPSRIPETFGRVIIEAQVSGIPVMTSDAGALPWVVGDGGIVLPMDTGVSEWARQLEDLLRDPARYGDLSRKALENTRRTEFQPDEVLARWERVLRDLGTPADGAA